MAAECELSVEAGESAVELQRACDAEGIGEGLPDEEVVGTMVHYVVGIYEGVGVTIESIAERLGTSPEGVQQLTQAVHSVEQRLTARLAVGSTLRGLMEAEAANLA